MGKLQVNGSAGILNDLTVSGNIFSTNIYPNTTLSYNIGLSSKEYGDGFIRQIFTRHIEPATNVNNDVYICYNNRGGSIRAYAPLDMSGIGSIVNLPIEGGLYWNPYVESSTDGTDAASITLHANGVGGGTELRITMANDGNDVINLNPASWVYLQGKAAFRVDDSWLRINETRGFSSGVYFGGSLVRTDSCLQVGDSGAAFGAYNDGSGYFANTLHIGSHVSIWSDSEGGNISLRNPNNGNNLFQFDRCFSDGLRLYSSVDGGANATAEWAFYNDGRFQTSRIIGTDYGYGLRVQSLNRGTGAGWTEGIWVEPAGNGYATLALGKTDRSSVIALVHHSNGNDHYLEKKNSRGQWTYQLPEVTGTLINSGNIGSQSVNYANSAGNADRVYPISSNPNNSHPGYGLKVFYSWDQGQVGNDNGGYANGITIGSHPGDQAYGFQIVQNMWNDRTYTRRYNQGWQSWKTLAWTDDLAAYLPLSGGTMTGHLYATSGLSWNNSYWTPNGNIYCQPTGNGQEWSFDVGASGYTGCYWHVWSAKHGCSMLRCDADTNAVGIPSGPLYLGPSCYGPNLPGASYVGQIFFKT